MKLPIDWKHHLFMKTLFLHRMILRKRGQDIYTANMRRYELVNDDPRAATLELMSSEIYRYNIDGSTAELGVFQGNFARRINHYFPDRKLYLFDTFEGFDARDAEVDRKGNFSEATQDFSATSVELVLNNMEHRDNCIVRKGWFPETAEGVDDNFCFVSLDTDLYQPMLAGLEFFYPRLVHGGVIMIHDFNNWEYQGIRQAVKEFCDRENIGYVCLSDSCGSAVIVK